jgi:hypothetical protein
MLECWSDDTDECFNRGVLFLNRLDFRRRTDPSKAVWRTRLKHAGMTVLGRQID